MLGRVKLTNTLVSKSLQKDEKVVEAVMDFFYRELHAELRECNSPHVFVRDLGTFTLKINSVNTRLKKLWYLRKIAEENPNLSRRLKDRFINGMTREMFNLFRIRRMLKDYRKEYKELKNETKSGKISNDN